MTRGTYSILFLAVVLLPASALAQTSELYLTTWNTETYVIQDGAVVNQFWRQSGGDGPPLAVSDTIKMFGGSEGNVGHQYSLDGDLLSGTYPNNTWEGMYDGTTDGTNNYVRQSDFEGGKAVVVGDSDWGNMAESFEPAVRGMGITYDGVNDSLWLTRGPSMVDGIQEYDLAGNLLFEFDFDSAIEDATGLAWDPADDTLWMVVYEAGLRQYSKQGELLQTMPFPGGIYGVYGAEFAIPEPGTLTLLVFSVVGLLRRR